MSRVGIVVIGRNEGVRLEECLRSLGAHRAYTVYVDSASSDASPERAVEYGVAVLRLVPEEGLSAARARQAGFVHLMSRWPQLEQVFFVDGDCVVEPGFVERAGAVLAAQPDVAAVCGRRRERAPEASVYDRLCDLEWDTPVGEAAACGGDALYRVRALWEVRGFDPSLIAGEEPELGHRLRIAGWRILRIDAPMTVHEAAIGSLRAWLRRARRSGYAYACVSQRHRWTGPLGWPRATAGILAWGLLLPLAVGLGAVATPWAGAGASLYLLHALRVYRHERSRGRSGWHAGLQASFLTLAKPCQAAGAIGFFVDLLARRRARPIEYKASGAAGTARPSCG